jgi:hypothetical protein
MNKYLATVRIRGQLVKTIVFADSSIHASLLLQYKYGMNCIAVNPSFVNEVCKVGASLLDSSLKTIRPLPPMSIEKSRINSLKQGVIRSKEQLQAERERQRRRRDSERRQKQG